MDFAARIKSVRESIGKNQKEMAIALDASLSAIQSYESGRQLPGGKVLQTLARMGFDTNWLLTGEGDMRRENVGAVKENLATWECHSPYLGNGDPDLAEIVDILQHDLPETKRFILKVLRGRKETKEGLEGLGLKLRDES